MFSVFQKRRSTREWHLPIVIMEGKHLMDRKLCLSTVRELRCLIRGTWVSSIATSTLRPQLNKTPMVSCKYKLRWKKKLTCPLWAPIANCDTSSKTPLKSVKISRHFSCPNIHFFDRLNWSLACLECSFKPVHFWSGHFYSRNLALRQHVFIFPWRSTGPDRC